MTIEWNEKLKTGNSEIDCQHQELVVMLNRLGRFRCGEDSFDEAFKELEDYVNNHFKTEEALMEKLNYPEYKEHKACHDRFVEDFEKIYKKADCTDNICDLGDKLFHFVEDWILKHYSYEDIVLAEYIRNHS